jgi:hypothetical protein
VFQFILLVASCCGLVQNDAANASLEPRKRICREEQVLLVLMERKRRLIEETEELEARRSAASGSPPNVPAKNDCSEGDPKWDEEDLIDMSAGESRGTIRQSRSAPLALTAGDKDITRNEFGTTENNPDLEAF